MSAIVLAALVVMWAVVLVPMFLKRSERSQEMAGPARFAGAMRVLSRRRRTPELPADQRRAAVISAALGAAPTRSARPVRPAPSPARVAERRSARVAARRRGLAVMTAALLVSLSAALVVGGWVWIVQGAVDVFVLAGFAQLRAGAIADRASLGLPRTPMRPAARVADVAQSVAQSVAPQPVSPPALRRDKHLIFDAVTGAPIVSRPRVAPAVAAATASTRASRPFAAPASVTTSVSAAMPAATPAAGSASMPADYYDAPSAPPRPEHVRVPLLDPVDTDPDTLTDGIELLDGILSRASGQ